eukprot:PhM_4_TR12016/c0_g1_i1/m.105256
MGKVNPCVTRRLAYIRALRRGHTDGANEQPEPLHASESVLERSVVVPDPHAADFDDLREGDVDRDGVGDGAQRKDEVGVTEAKHLPDIARGSGVARDHGLVDGVRLFVQVEDLHTRQTDALCVAPRPKQLDFGGGTLVDLDGFLTRTAHLRAAQQMRARLKELLLPRQCGRAAVRWACRGTVLVTLRRRNVVSRCRRSTRVSSTGRARSWDLDGRLVNGVTLIRRRVFKDGFVVRLHRADDAGLCREENDLRAGLATFEHARRLLDLPTEDDVPVELHLHVARAAEGVHSGLVVVPDPNHCDGDGDVERDGDDVAAPLGVRREPHVHVVAGVVDAVHHLVRSAWVVVVFRQHVNAVRVPDNLRCSVRQRDEPSCAVEEVQSCQANVVGVAPRDQSVHGEHSAARQQRYHGGD